MRILVYTSLYPSPAHPTHGIFVGELVKSLARKAEVRVIAPENALRRLLSRPHPVEGFRENVADTTRCLFWNVPKVLKAYDAALMARCTRAAFGEAVRSGADLIHAHYAYPDGAAAALLAARAGLPLVVTCHGSDINVLARHPARERRIAQALRQAAAVVAVSRDLADKIARLGVDPGRIRHIPNGVDLSRFSAGDKAQARRRLGLERDGPLVAAVGRLEPVKGYDRLLRAVARLEDVRLLLVGDGSQRGLLARLARELGLTDRVRFAGLMPHEALAACYQAADALVISSHSEGWPTVIHEALACETPVVAPAVGGIPEALADPGLGVLLDAADPVSLAGGIRQALARSWDPSRLRRAAAAHDWNGVAGSHLELYADVLRRTMPAPPQGAENHAR